MSDSDWSSEGGVDVVARACGALNASLVRILSGATVSRCTRRRRLARQAHATMASSSSSSSLHQHQQQQQAVKRRRLHDMLVCALLQDQAPTRTTAAAGVDTRCSSDKAASSHAKHTDDGDAATPQLHALVACICQCIRASDDRAETAAAVLRGLSDPLNRELRDAVLTGALAPHALVALDDENLLNPRVRAQQQAARHAREQQRTVEYWQRLRSTITHLYTCPSCGCNECYANFRSTDFVKWQGDDPTPTLLTCTKCTTSFRA